MRLLPRGLYLVEEYLGTWEVNTYVTASCVIRCQTHWQGYKGTLLDVDQKYALKQILKSLYLSI